MHPANPKHLILGLEFFRHILRHRHLPDDGFLTLRCRCVDIAEVLGQFSRSQQIGIQDALVLFRIIPPPLSPDTDAVFGPIRQDQVWNAVIAYDRISAAILLK